MAFLRHSVPTGNRTVRRCICAAVVLAVLLCGCGAPKARQYTDTYLDVFDTVTTVIGTADSRETFDEMSQTIHQELQRYHRLFDIYREYEGINNLKTVNDLAHIEPVEVDGEIIALLQFCKEVFRLTGGKVNAAMGSVLQLWHRARSQGLEDPQTAALPSQQALVEAAMHTDFSQVIIDTEKSTVYITDPQLKVDVGAIAKGWAVQQVASRTPEGFLISVGGNVCVTGPKDARGTPWTVGIQHPDDAKAYLQTLAMTGGSLVTSGDYQRAYMVDGESYHHIIDPDTLYPARYWRGVTVVCEDSGLADALSTALFVLPQEEGQRLLDRCGAQALWMDTQGNIYKSSGFDGWSPEQ